MLNKDGCERIFERALAAARALGVSHLEAIVAGGSQALTRFANNGIHQNVAEQSCRLSVRPVIEGRTARATTNRLDDEGIRRVVEEAVSITRLQESDPDLPPLASPSPCPEVPRYDDATALFSPSDRAQAVAAAIAEVASQGQIAAGIFSTDSGVHAIFNSNGVAACHRETMARFSITAMAADSSGWAKAGACAAGALDPVALARSAARKAALSAAPRELAPGRYTVILEPAAVLDLVGQMAGDFSATALREGRSFLNDRMGHQLFGANIHIRDDVRHPLQAGAPFDGEGVPRLPLSLVAGGVVTEIAWSRQEAARAGVEPTGHGFPVPSELGEAPVNIVIEGGNTPVEEMIAGTARGILVTRLWYIREVDPYQKIFTGMTRDGTFLVEDGQVVCGVRNFRFNQGLMELLSNVEAISPTVRASGEEAFDMAAPAMKAHGFNFTEVTRF